MEALDALLHGLTIAAKPSVVELSMLAGFGVMGFLMRRFDYPVAPLVLGMVLGDLMEKGFRRGLVLSDGELGPFFTRPISGTLLGCAIGVLVYPLVRWTWRSAVGRRTTEVPR